MDIDFRDGSELDKGKALKNLMDDLKRFSADSDEEIVQAEDNLDLIVDQVVQGADIRQRFPNFYKMLLRNKGLRQQFIDAISVTLSPDLPALDPFLLHRKHTLSFLKQNMPGISTWPIYLSQTKFQLMGLFFPLETSYRGAANVTAAPLYSLLRKEFVFNGVTYTILLEGELSEQKENALSASISVTAETSAKTVAFPIQAMVHWGEYASELTFEQEGKQVLPDIPLASVFNGELTEVKADLFLTLSSATL